jgi:tetratricopeptide (TPR) repeat protein
MATPYNNIEDTSPVSTPPETPKKLKARRWPWVLVGFVILLLGALLGGLAGYNNGVQMRLAKQSSEATLAAATQFQLGVADMDAGHYAMALKRFQYVIEVDPSYPGAAEKLTQVMFAMASTQTSTPAPTPTIVLTPTPDTRGEEEIFGTARAVLASLDWAKTIDTLDSLRRLNNTYRAIEVDGMYYVALRNRGMDKIRNGMLEEGIYDMSLTERFGPLDKEANTYRDWARLYITGASFWELDWVEVINYFSQVYAATPMLRDRSGMTAADRYREALVSYGDQLVKEEKYCEADEQYALAFQVSPDDTLARTSTAVYSLCNPATATPEPSPTFDFSTPVEPTFDPGLEPTAETPGPPPEPSPTTEPPVATP